MLPANTVERLCAAAMGGSSTKGGNAACSQITLGTFDTRPGSRKTRNKRPADKMHEEKGNLENYVCF